MAVARSRPWTVVAAGWAFTLAQLIYPVGTAPVLATEVVPFVAVVLAVIFIVQNGTASKETPQPISASTQQLVAAT
jgi:ABC-type uncharacterized transport system permease subunit